MEDLLGGEVETPELQRAEFILTVGARKDT
jgi:hypothetical protein